MLVRKDSSGSAERSALASFRGDTVEEAALSEGEEDQQGQGDRQRSDHDVCVVAVAAVGGQC